MSGRHLLTVAEEAADRVNQRRLREQLLQSARAIVPNGRAGVGQIDGGGDAWYTFRVEESETYRIETIPPVDGVGIDTIVELYEADGATLRAEDDDSGDKAYSRLREHLDEEGYYIRVRGFSEYEEGGFRITVSRDGP